MTEPSNPRKILLRLLICLLLPVPGVTVPGVAYGQGGRVVFGVNPVGAESLTPAQQDTLLEQLRQSGVTTIRIGLGPKFRSFILRAQQKGIGTIAIVYPNSGPQKHLRSADKADGLTYAQAGLTDEDPVEFKSWLEAELAPLEAANVKLRAFELGNEINGPYFNGDFLPEQASGRVLGINDLKNPADPEGRAIAASYRAYLKITAALKEVRDQSRVNRETPILSAGLADGGMPGKRPGQKLDGVSIPGTLEFLRENGIDSLVDGYGVHVYPHGETTNVQAQLGSLNQDAFSKCTSAKPCWVTEWGFKNADQSCPAKDQPRAAMFSAERNAFESFVRQGRVVALIVYSWSGAPEAVDKTYGIYRCGGLTEAGKAALTPR